jgi:hypothetical protein
VPKVEVKQLKNPRFALEFQLTQIAQKFMKVVSAPPPKAKNRNGTPRPYTDSPCGRLQESWPKRKMGVSLPSTTEKKEVAKVRFEAINQPIFSVEAPSLILFASKPQMKLRTNDVGNLVKQGFDQLAAANALEITDNDFVRTHAPLQHTPMPCSDPWMCTRVMYDYAGQGYQAPQLAGRAHRHCRAQLVRRYA